MLPKLIVICGSTATGKTETSIALAKQLNSVILSADSRCVYKEFNIGTAKPNATDQQSIPHHLIDICDPTETLTVADYQHQAQQLISQYHQKGIIPLLVGGTGLYIKAIVRGLKIPRVGPHPALRTQLQSLGQHQLYAILQQIDSVAAQKIHPNDPVRTLRALEVFYVTGRPISEQQGENPPPYQILQIGLDCQPELLQKRIEDRTEKMLDAGWVDEVNYLGNKYGWDLPLLATLGYQEIKQYLMGELSFEAAKDLIILHTRQFAKRQRTWFRAISQIQWLDAGEHNLSEKIYLLVEDFLNQP
ncbi:MAG TPA: tRNA (adenosine(37)-N6)-dimethylallyltransferase MiaA [Halomicronema sp.]